MIHRNKLSPGFERVESAFENILHQYPSAAQAAVRFRGELVVDLDSRAPGSPSVDPETPFLTFSVSKAFTALAVLRLMEDGCLELDAPIGRYWPEFAQGGKEAATLRHALLHQAGIPAPHLRRQIFLWPFWSLLTRSLARQKALFAPGTQTAYHLVNFGFILGEVVRRVSGEPIDIYLYNRFFRPMGLKNTWMRIPTDHLHRSPRLVPLSPEVRSASFLFNLPAIRRALIPAASLRSTARELVAFFQMLVEGGIYHGQPYLQPQTVALATQTHFDGIDRYIQNHIRWGFGMIIGGDKHEDPDPKNWGMGYGSSEATFAGFGLGTCMVWADRRSKLVTAFTTNGVLNHHAANQRWATLSNAVWEAVESS